MKFFPFLICLLLGQCAIPVVLASNSVKIAAGQSAGLYYKTAATICLAIEKDLKKPCEVVITSGSNENKKLLDQGKVDLALIQENLISSEVKIHRLYSEYLFILYKGSKINKFSDIFLKKTSIDKNSGTFSILQSISSDLNFSSFSADTSLDLKRNFDDFCSNSQEVNFYNIGYPSDLIETILLQCSNISIYSFSDEEFSKLKNASAIKYLGKTIKTVKTDVYLVSKIYSQSISNCINSNFSSLKEINIHMQ